MNNTMKLMKKQAKEITDEEIEWTYQRKVQWEKVPDNVNIYLNAIKGSVRYYGDIDTNTKEIVEALTKTSLTQAEILEVFGWLMSKKDHVITYGEGDWYGRDYEYRVTKKPKVDYEREHWSRTYRGKASKYYHRKHTVREMLSKQSAGMIKYMAEYNQHNDAHAIWLDQRNLDNMENWINTLEKDNKSLYTSGYQIVDHILATLGEYRNGNSSSTHGKFSFALSYNTRYIDGETGELIPLDLAEATTKFMDYKSNVMRNHNATQPNKLRNIHESLVKQRDTLLTRWLDAHTIAYDASVMWKNTWDKFWGYLPPEMIDNTDNCKLCGKEIEVPEGEVWSDGCWECYLEQEPDWREGDDE